MHTPSQTQASARFDLMSNLPPVRYGLAAETDAESTNPTCIRYNE